MPHEVFISYSSVDKTAAETVCLILEQNGISCWIAPRDITPGLDFAEGIIDGIKSSKLFILVYSSNSNNSKQVIREVDRAVHAGLPVINLRLEDVPLSKQLEYYLSSVHWLDALKPPLEEHINKLSGVVKIFLRKDDAREGDLEKAVRDGILKVGQDKKSIAVLPFKNMSNDPEQEYFSDGMMEEILDRLFKIGDLKVISRTSSMHYKNSDKSIKEIARELGVASIIEGSVRRAGNMVRIAVQLIDAGTDAHLWSEIYNGDLSDLSRIFNIQSEVAQTVASELKAVISPEEKRLIEKIPSTDLEVYEKYLKARSFWGDYTRESLSKALDYLNSAVEKNPGWAPLYAGMAEIWLWIQQGAFEPPDVAGPKILENLEKAKELDPDISQVHYMSAMIAHLVEWDWEKSEREFLKTLAINPNDANARNLYAQLLLILQRNDEALAQAELALSLDPSNPAMKLLYSGTMVQAGDFKTGLSVAEEIVADNPKDLNANYMIELAAFSLKEYDKVIKAVKVLLPLFAIEEATYEKIERIYRESGIVAAYKEIMTHLEKYAENNYVSFFDMSMRSIIANQPDKAMDYLEKGFELHDPQMAYITATGRYFEPLFGNPRFIAVCEKMNLQIPKSD
ncbi:MAG: TIR domain-containing protein [Bacteroidales bacterium]|nr:TIR domain-containing protein [Bacteroidales bacterium]